MSAASMVLDNRASVTTQVSAAVKQSFIWGLGGVLTKAVSFLMLPLYTHYLAPSEYGIWELLDLLMSLLGMMINMGLTAAILKYYAAAATAEERRRVSSTSFILALTTGLGVFAAGLALLPAVTHLLFGPKVTSLYLFLSFTISVMAYIATVPYTLMRAKDRAQLLVTYDTIGVAFILALNILFVVVFRLGLLGVLLSPVIVGAVKTVIVFYWTRHDIGFSLDRKRLRQLLVFGGPLVLSNLAMFVLNFSDRFFLREFRGLELVGIYAVGYKFGYMLSFLLIQPFNMMWQARMFVIHQQSDHVRIFRNMFVLYSVLLIASGLALALFGPTVVPMVVDPRYAGAAAIIPVVTLAYVFLGMGYFLQVGMFLASRTMLIGLVSGVASVVDLAFNYVLIGSYGMMGAAWATLFGFLALAGGSYYLSHRVFPMALGMGRVLKALLLAAGVFLLSQWPAIQASATLLLWKTALLAVFAGIVWATGVLSPDEIATVASVRDNARRMLSRWLTPIGWARS
jgi:O-antigen/teichoic acid export membrane protein